MNFRFLITKCVDHYDLKKQNEGHEKTNIMTYLSKRSLIAQDVWNEVTDDMEAAALCATPQYSQKKSGKNILEGEWKIGISLFSVKGARILPRRKISNHQAEDHDNWRKSLCGIEEKDGR